MTDSTGANDGQRPARATGGDGPAGARGGDRGGGFGGGPGLARRRPEDPATAPPPASPSEYTVKAVFLYSFGRFVQWPAKTFANDSEPFVIGMAGEDPFGRALDEIAAKKTIQDRHIAIRRFAAPDDYRGPCQILFVSRSLDRRRAGGS